MYDLIIIGLGPAGINASIYAKKSNLNTLVIEKNIPGGTLNSIKNVENYLGYKQITGPELAMEFYKQFKSLNIPMVNEEVLSISSNEKIKTVKTNKNEYQTKAIIISTGRGPKKLGLDNENLPGISYCVLCDGALYKNKNVAIYGNNPKVLEETLYLSNLAEKVYLIINNDKLLGSDELINKITESQNVEIIKNSKIKSINGQQKLESISLDDRTIKIDGLFINNEYGPLTYFCKDLNITDQNDYIIVNEKNETKEKGIFACGDSTKKEIYQIITAASEGATAAINAYKYIKENN